MPKFTSYLVSLSTLLVFLQECVVSQIIVSTYAGNGTAGFADGPAASAKFNIASGVALDSSGNVFVADKLNSRIRRISTTGIVSTFAGSGAAGSADGVGTSATFRNPIGLAIDKNNNIYVADSAANRIRRITPSGIVTTYAGTGVPGYLDGPATSAMFNTTVAIAIDSSNNVYVSDKDNNAIRKITPDGTVSTLAGNGTAGFAEGAGSNSMFSSPYSLAVDSLGNVFVADCGNNRVRRITPTGVVSTYAGSGVSGYLNGDAAIAQMNCPIGIAVDSMSNVYISEWGNRRIRVVMTNGTVSTIAGNGTAAMVDGPVASASFYIPWGIALDPNRKIYVSERDGNKIRLVSGLDGLFPTTTSSADTSTATTSPVAPIYTADPAKPGGLIMTTVLAISIPILVLVVVGIAGLMYMRHHHLSFSLIWQRGWPKLVLIDKREWDKSPTNNKLVK